MDHCISITEEELLRRIEDSENLTLEDLTNEAIEYISFHIEELQ